MIETFTFVNQGLRIKFEMIQFLTSCEQRSSGKRDGLIAKAHILKNFTGGLVGSTFSISVEQNRGIAMAIVSGEGFELIVDIVLFSIDGFRSLVNSSSI